MDNGLQVFVVHIDSIRHAVGLAFGHRDPRNPYCMSIGTVDTHVR